MLHSGIAETMREGTSIPQRTLKMAARHLAPRLRCSRRNYGSVTRVTNFNRQRFIRSKIYHLLAYFLGAYTLAAVIDRNIGPSRASFTAAVAPIPREAPLMRDTFPLMLAHEQRKRFFVWHRANQRLTETEYTWTHTRV